MLSVKGKNGTLEFESFEYAGVVDIQKPRRTETISKFVVLHEITPCILTKQVEGKEKSVEVNCVKVALSYSLPTKRKGSDITQVGATVFIGRLNPSGRMEVLISQAVVIDQRPNDFRGFNPASTQWTVNPQTLRIEGRLDENFNTKTGEEFTVKFVSMEFPYRVLRVYVKNSKNFPKRNYAPAVPEQKEQVLYESVARH